MGNHFHLVVETPQPNLVAGMKWFLGTYTSRFNRRHKLSGHLFSGRYKALIVDGSGSGYGDLRTVSTMSILTPLGPNCCLRSIPAHLPLEQLPDTSRRRASVRPWLACGPALGRDGYPARHGGRPPAIRAAPGRSSAPRKIGNEWKAIRRGWCLGDATFRQELLEQMAARMGEHHYGSERRESEQDKAERLVKGELAQAAWTEEDLKGGAIRSGETEIGRTAAQANDDDLEMDFRAPADGRMDALEQTALRCTAKEREVGKLNKLGTDPFPFSCGEAERRSCNFVRTAAETIFCGCRKQASNMKRLLLLISTAVVFLFRRFISTGAGTNRRDGEVTGEDRRGGGGETLPGQEPRGGWRARTASSCRLSGRSAHRGHQRQLNQCRRNGPEAFSIRARPPDRSEGHSS